MDLRRNNKVMYRCCTHSEKCRLNIFTSSNFQSVDNETPPDIRYLSIVSK